MGKRHPMEPQFLKWQSRALTVTLSPYTRLYNLTPLNPLKLNFSSFVGLHTSNRSFTPLRLL
jgi:hypothetical protein